MSFVDVFFWLSDTVVSLIHGITRIPWDESINRLIPFELPNEGLAFPILLGRLAFIGILAGIVIVPLSLPGRRRRLRIRGEKKIDPMMFFLPVVSICLWGEYIIVRDLFFGEKNLFAATYVGRIPADLGLLFRGQGDLQIVLEILVGLFIALLVLAGMALLLILPGMYFNYLRKTHGRLAPLFFLLHIGLFSAGLGLFLIVLYYGVVSGFVGAAVSTIVKLVLIVVLFEVLVYEALALVEVSFSVKPGDWENARKIAEDGFDTYGDDFSIMIRSTGEVLYGQEAMDYVQNHPAVFSDR